MKKLLLFSVIFIISLSFVNPATAVAIVDPLNAGTLEVLIGRISTAVAGLVGGIAVIMFIIAGICFLTSAGDPGKIQKAKDFLKYAIIGIVIALIAGPMVNKILEILGAG